MIRFSVALPVRNGMPYVKACIHSILGQTWPHFELLVLDNQSKDGTVEWIESLNDPRIRIWKADRPLSIVESWARIKDVPKLEYMTTIGHDDLLDPPFLENIARLIERHPDAALYQTGSRLIDSNGKVIRSSKPVPARETAAEYLTARLRYQRDVFGTGYVMRSADYDRLGGIPPFERLFFADDALWMALAKQSWKASDPAEAFSVRIHPESESASLPSLWPAFLRGLARFAAFVEEFVETDPPSADAYRQWGPSFFLRYHRNIYIFAIIEASQRGAAVDSSVRAQIGASLDQRMPDGAALLTRSPKVRALEMLNGSFLRPQVERLWKAYQHLRN